MIRKNSKAQSLIEYGLILGIATVALLSMQTYFKRGIQSLVKVVADDFGPQGERVNEIEVSVKKKVYYEGYNGKAPQLAVNSKNASTWTQTKTNLQGGSVETKTSGSQTIRGDTPSVSVGADYRKRKIN